MESMTVSQSNEFGRDTLHGYLGIEITALEHGRAEGRLPIVRNILAPHGFLHGGTVTAFADTVAGNGTFVSLPEGAKNFATLELKTNFLSTVVEGVALCVAEAVHLGRTTQLWDVTVSAEETAKTLALARITQYMIY